MYTDPGVTCSTKVFTLYSRDTVERAVLESSILHYYAQAV
uniref:Uncharacterized protein n=1 Tax=Anguilla anguilla TaxID=7936 RepID=A0A0E9SVH8_ANGAN